MQISVSFLSLDSSQPHTLLSPLSPLPPLITLTSRSSSSPTLPFMSDPVCGPGTFSSLHHGEMMMGCSRWCHTHTRTHTHTHTHTHAPRGVRQVLSQVDIAGRQVLSQVDIDRMDVARTASH